MYVLVVISKLSLLFLSCVFSYRFLDILGGIFRGYDEANCAIRVGRRACPTPFDHWEHLLAPLLDVRDELNVVPEILRCSTH